MPEDRSLDEFAGGDHDEEADDGAGDDGAGGDEADDTETAVTDDEVDADAVDADPATPTATWTTDGAACDRCGERVARRWLNGDALVCAACKEW